MKAAEHKSASISTIQKKSNTPFFDTEHASEQESPFFAPQEASGTDAFFQPATRPIIQTKLTVGQPNDKYEQEADNVADKVVQRLAKSDNTNHQSPITNHQSAPSVTEASTPIIQHKTEAPEEEKLDRKEENKEELPELQKSPVSAVGDDEGLQMKCAACEAEEESGHVQMKGNTEGVASSNIESQLNSSKGGGSSLPEDTRTSMESAMGADFSNVRVHTGSHAVQMSQDLNAQAFTHGSDVYFNEGKYNPSGTEGGRLLAHELTHTVQQGGAKNIQRNSKENTPTESDNKIVGSKDEQIQAKGNFPEIPVIEETKEDMKVKGGEAEDKTKGDLKEEKKGAANGKEQGGQIIDIPPPIVEEQDSSNLSMKAVDTAVSANSLGATNIIQRFTPPVQNVENPKSQEAPADGEPIMQAVESKKANDDGDKGDEISREDKLKEANAFKKAGPTTPEVDRGAIAKEQSIEQKAEIKQKVNEEKKSEGEGEKKEGKGKEGKKSKGEMLASKAQRNVQKAQALSEPTKPEPFIHPIIQTPVDKENEELPPDKETDEAVRGLGYIGELLAEQGYSIQLTAYEQEKTSFGLDGVLDKTREDLAYAEEGVTILNANHEIRTQINEDSNKGLEESKQRQQFVAEKATEIEAETGEKRVDSEQLKVDSSSKAEEAKSNVPDDEDAAEDAEQQNADLDSSAEGATKADDAVAGAQAKSKQLIADAEKAAEKNTDTQTTIKESADILNQTRGRIDEMAAKNELSKAQIGKAAGGPDKLRTFAQVNYQTGSELITSAKTMQTDLNDIQNQYLNDNASQVPGLKEIEQKEKEEAEKQNAPDSEVEELMLLSSMSKEEQEAYVANMEEVRKQQLLDKLNLIIATDEKENNTEGGGEENQDKRAPWYGIVLGVRKGRLKKVFGTANEKMSYLTGAQKRILAERLKEESIKGDIKSILTWQSVKQMLNPWTLAKGIVTGPWTAIKEIGSGFKNFPEKWKSDPLGAVLQLAADIMTGLATLFSSIAALAGIIVAVLAIVGFFFPPAWLPIPFLGTVLTFCGKGALITGALAIFFNRLAYMKNLSDAGTAETAEGLFGEVGEMKKNNYGELKGAMAMIEGAASMKMGAALKATPKFKILAELGFAERMAVLKNMGKTTFESIKSMPKRLIGAISRTFGKGKAGLIEFRDWLKGLFSKKKGQNELTIPQEKPPLPKDKLHVPEEEPHVPKEEPHTPKEEPHTPKEEPHTPKEKPPSKKKNNTTKGKKKSTNKSSKRKSSNEAEKMVDDLVDPKAMEVAYQKYLKKKKNQGKKPVTKERWAANSKNAQKGVVAEHLGDADMVAKGNKKLNGSPTQLTDKPQGPGIDGLWKKDGNPPTYTVTDAKYGKSKLGTSKYGDQLSDDWITHHLDNLDLPEAEIDAIKQAMKEGKLIRKVQQIDKHGNIIDKLVDASGKIIK